MPSCPACRGSRRSAPPPPHRPSTALHWLGTRGQDKQTFIDINTFMRLCREEESVSMLVQAVIMCHYNLIFSYFQVDVEKCADREKL